jgi:hypothetical protein
MDSGSLPRMTSTGSILLIGNRTRYRIEKPSITCFIILVLMMISPVCSLPSKATYDRWIACSSPGGTGQQPPSNQASESTRTAPRAQHTDDLIKCHDGTGYWSRVRPLPPAARPDRARLAQQRGGRCSRQRRPEMDNLREPSHAVDMFLRNLFKSEFKEVQSHSRPVGRNVCAERPPIIGVENTPGFEMSDRALDRGA